jgi:hypothetical protein
MQGGVAEELKGDEQSAGSPVALGPSQGPALAGIGPAGGATTVWPTSVDGSSSVAVREDYAGGAFQSARLAGALPGPLGGLSLGEDLEGDALLGWSQGPPGRSEVLSAFVQAPPSSFLVLTPIGWIRAGSARISWEAAPASVAGVSYAIYVDGHLRARSLTGLTSALSSTVLGDGVHLVQVLATDADGQQTMSQAGKLKIDVNPPIVRVKAIDGGRGVRVTIRDAASGVKRSAIRVSFGDAGHAQKRETFTHLYGHAGLYTITALVSDRVGNKATVHLQVRIR